MHSSLPLCSMLRRQRKAQVRNQIMSFHVQKSWLTGSTIRDSLNEASRLQPRIKKAERFLAMKTEVLKAPLTLQPLTAGVTSASKTFTAWDNMRATARRYHKPIITEKAMPIYGACSQEGAFHAISKTALGLDPDPPLKSPSLGRNQFSSRQCAATRFGRSF